MTIQVLPSRVPEAWVEKEAPRERGILRANRAWREVLVLAGLLLVYSLIRMFADTDLGAARANAAGLLRLENAIGVDLEVGLNQFVDGHRTWAVAMSFWYATLHYVVTGWVLWRLFGKNHARYATARIALLTGSALALAGYVLLPMAPPRLMQGGYVDVLASTSDVGWWSGHASAPAGLGALTNELAAMPSLHVGWAFWVAWALWTVVGPTGRACGVAYALGTFVVVVGTGNHWVVDGVAGVVVILVGIFIARTAGPGASPGALSPGAHRV